MGRPRPEMGVPARACCTGAAWLSSARVVRCWVKSRNERNPRLQLPSRLGGHSEGTPVAKATYWLKTDAEVRKRG